MNNEDGTLGFWMMNEKQMIIVHPHFTQMICCETFCKLALTKLAIATNALTI
jgi:hypothetical protein